MMNKHKDYLLFHFQRCVSRFSLSTFSSHWRRGETDSWPFVMEVLNESAKLADDCQKLRNLSAFFDNSGGEGKEPEKVPEIPTDYPHGMRQPVGFTGGIKATNVQQWLTKYEQRASECGCWLLSDAQSGFRKENSRGKPIDVEEMKKLMSLALEWGSVV